VYVGRAYILYEDGELRCDLYFVTSKSRGSILFIHLFGFLSETGLGGKVSYCKMGSYCYTEIIGPSSYDICNLDLKVA
jgi:hypothetical protein